MGLAEGIRKHGFRKWYERELIRGHAYLALTFLCCVGVFAGMDGLSQSRSTAGRWADAVTVLLCAAVGFWSLRQYLQMLMHVEAMAQQANCPQCQAYGRLKLEGESAQEGSLMVCCRGCQRRWTIKE